MKQKTLVSWELVKHKLGGGSAKTSLYFANSAVFLGNIASPFLVLHSALLWESAGMDLLGFPKKRQNSNRQTIRTIREQHCRHYILCFTDRILHCHHCLSKSESFKVHKVLWSKLYRCAIFSLFRWKKEEKPANGIQISITWDEFGWIFKCRTGG